MQGVKAALPTQQGLRAAAHHSPDRFRLFSSHSAVGTTLSHEVTKRYGLEGLPEGTIHIKLNGCAGAGCSVVTDLL